jgi:hypothetical protein
VRNRRFEYFTHSNYFLPGHYTQWIEILNEPLVEFRTIRSSSLPIDKNWKDIRPYTHEIDEIVYKGLKGYEESRIPEGMSEQWLTSNPDIYTILVDQADRVHGYLNAMPLISCTFDAMISGTRKDNSVTPSEILTYEDRMEVDIYLMSIAIHPDSRRLAQGPNQSAFHRLLFGLTHRLECLARENQIFVNRLGAVGWTDEGKRLCEIIGMNMYRTDPFNHPTYLLDLRQAKENSRSHRLIKELLEVYLKCR